MPILEGHPVIQLFASFHSLHKISMSMWLFRSSGLDPDGHNCYLSAVEVNTLTSQDLVYDDDWSIYKNLPCGNGSPSADGNE